MKNFIKIVVIVTLASVCHVAYSACSQNNNKLHFLVGVDSGSGNVYASLSSTTNECSCSYVRFSTLNTDTKMVLSVLLAAKLAEREVRVDFRDAASCDSGYRVYLK